MSTQPILNMDNSNNSNKKRPIVITSSAHDVVDDSTSSNDIVGTSTKAPLYVVTNCPYLDTIQRSVLDFDLEATCSVTLESGPHIYACLVCGKYFRGRGRQTPAYIHAVNESHYMYCHLQNGTFHCLPDGYEVYDPSLNDIRNALHPTYTEQDIEQLDNNSELSRDIFGRLYLPGFVGLNNPNKIDCINVVVQALAHVRPIRDYFLRQSAINIESHATVYTTPNTQLGQAVSPIQAIHVTKCFGELVRKMWSHHRLKSHVDPHKLINAIAAASKNKYKIGQDQLEIGNFMAWFLHQLHVGTGGIITSASQERRSNKKKKRMKTSSSNDSPSSVIEQVFQGKVRVTIRQARRKRTKATDDEENADDRGGSDAEEDDDDGNNKDNNENDNEEMIVEETEMDTNFLQLTLDISEKPVFRDEDGGLVIPQEPLVTVLQKFDGVTFSDAIQRGIVQRRRYNIQTLPPYLILHFARFTSNQYSRVKNPTIVAFPVKNLDLSSYVEPVRTKAPIPTENEIRNMSIKEIKDLLTKYGHKNLADQAIERSDLIETALNFIVRTLPEIFSYKYDLVANIIHESPSGVGREGKFDPLQEGSYKCHVQNRSTRQWYEIQDLHVQDIMPQQIGISESYLLILERKTSANN